MSIYDRWGNVIFYDEMDGYLKGDKMNQLWWRLGWRNEQQLLTKQWKELCFQSEVEDTIRRKLPPKKERCY
jgi:hypothetical protein